MTPRVSIAFFLLAAIFGAVGQYFYKSGADSSGGGLVSYLTNIRILVGVTCYVVVMVLFVAAFKRGGALSVLYPLYASTFIWGALISHYAYGTAIKPVNVLGMLVLIFGMHLMGK